MQRTLPVLAAVALLAIGVSSAPGQQDGVKSEANAVRVPDNEVRAHLVEPREQIRTANANTIREWPGVTLELVVGPDGRVVSAVATDGPKEFFAEAVRVASTWKYEPFLGPDGKPVLARIRDGIAIWPPELRPAVHKPFPRIKDWKSLVITLERSACYGSCPSYKVEIHGDGTVLYTGQAYVALKGQHRGRISQESLLQLFEAFRSADYLSLNDRYAWSATDNPTYSTSIAFDGISKSVVDYVGEDAGMPVAVSELEEKIDRLARTEKWTIGTAETAASLAEEGWDFKAQDAAHEGLVAAVAERGHADAVRSLIAAGAPVDGRSEIRQSALFHAAFRGDVEMVRVLLESGAGSGDKNGLGTALSVGARSGKPEIVRLLLARGADPSYTGPDGATVLMSAAHSGRAEIVAELLKFHPDVTAHDREGKTVLMYLDKIYGKQEEQPGANRAEVARMLVAAGADVNAQDNEGNTPLMEVPFEADVARVLIEKGADVNARNKKGWTPLMHASSPSVVGLLLASGADPVARDDAGTTVLENAQHFGSTEIVKLIQAALAGKVPAARQ